MRLKKKFSFSQGSSEKGDFEPYIKILILLQFSYNSIVFAEISLSYQQKIN